MATNMPTTWGPPPSGLDRILGFLRKPAVSAGLRTTGAGLMAQSDRRGSLLGNLGRALPGGLSAAQQAQKTADYEKSLEGMAPQMQALLKVLGPEGGSQFVLRQMTAPPPEFQSVTDAQGRPMTFDPSTGAYGTPVGEGKQPSWQHMESGGFQYQINPETGEIRPVLLPDGTPAPVEPNKQDITQRAPTTRDINGQTFQWNYDKERWEPAKVVGMQNVEPPPTAQERQNQRLGAAAVAANTELNRLDAQMTGIPESVIATAGAGGVVSSVKNWALTKAAGTEGQQAVTAALNFINPVVRYLSGAQMNESEAGRYFRALIPQPGEGQAAIEMKRRMRQTLLDAMSQGQYKAPDSDTPDLDMAEKSLEEIRKLAEMDARWGVQR